MTEYPSRMDMFDLGRWGKISFQQWLFPNGNPANFSESIVDSVSASVPTGSFAIDIGGFTGDTMIPIALATGRLGRVLVFEPGPTSFPFLQRNRDLNSLAWVDLVHKAVTDIDTKVTFHYTDDGFINGGYSAFLDIKPEGCGNTVPFHVDGVHLSAFLHEHYAEWIEKLSFVKIDTEGFDRIILDANAALFQMVKPVIQIEVYPFLSRRERKALADSVQNIGYCWDGGESVFVNENPRPTDVICRAIST